MHLLKYIKQQNNLISYYYLIALSLSLFLTLAIFYDIFQIHIYRHDAFYYISADKYLYHVYGEGRWLNYIFYPLVKYVSGSIWSIFILISFAYFIFYSSYKWTQNIYYSSLLSLLFLQIPSFYALIQWPATAAPTFFVLLLAVYLVNRLPIFNFYILFGILFFATMSNYYYVLPLLHLSLLTKDTTKENIKLVFFKIIPAWAIGFIIGYIVTQLILYLVFGRIMTIAAFRNPHYIHSLHDLVNNFQLSFNYLSEHIKSIFSNNWIIITGITGFLISLWGRKKDLIFLPLLIFSAIIIVHYIVVMPVGIKIEPRTIVATWVGIFAIMFFIPSVKQWKVFLLTPIIILFTYKLYLSNHNNLQWYHTVMNTHYNKLKKVSPMPPEMYKGVVLFSNDQEMQQKNNFISKQYNVHKNDYIEGLGFLYRWVPSAKEAGFREVITCDTQSNNSICNELINNYITTDLLKKKTDGFYNIIGEYNNLLILSLNNENLIKVIEDKKKAFYKLIDTLHDKQPLVSSEFDIYKNENTLIFYKNKCSSLNVADTFFLHIIPVNISDLVKNRQKYGFQNMDFKFYSSGGSINDNQCIVQIKLPNYDIKKIQTGQYKDSKLDWDVVYYFDHNFKQP